MKAKQDWQFIGRFVGTLVQLFTVISNVFKKAEVGLEAVEWLVGSGKGYLTVKLTEIAEEFKRQNLKATPPQVLKATIDLDVVPSLPFEGAVVEKHIGGGKVTIEKRADGLYIDGKKIGLHRSDRQLGGKWLKGYELREELAGKPVLNAVVLDFLYEHQEFIPVEWKGLAVFFWGTVYRYSDGILYVRYLCWRDGTWRRHYDWLDGAWNDDSPAAVSAS